MENNPLALLCLFEGEATSNAFSVKIESTKTIGSLKDHIKTKILNTFNGIDAKDLTLWRVDQPVLAANKHNLILLSAIDSPTELDPTDDISDVFPEAPPKKTIHIIVQRPPQEHAPIPARISTPLSGHLSDESRPASPTDVRADLDKIADKFFSPASQNITFLNEFVQGSHNLPVTKGSIS
ncbi:hypothetical protein BGZ88_007965, partial [Linnemannia elongata]